MHAARGRILTAEEVGRLFGVQGATVKRWVRADLPGLRGTMTGGGQLAFHEGRLRDWLANHDADGCYRPRRRTTRATGMNP